MKLLIVALAVVLVADIVSVQAQEEEEEGPGELPDIWGDQPDGPVWGPWGGPRPGPWGGPRPGPWGGPFPGPWGGPRPGPWGGPRPGPWGGPFPGPFGGPRPRPWGGPFPGPWVEPLPGPWEGPFPGSLEGPLIGPVGEPLPGPWEGPLPGPVGEPLPGPWEGPLPGPVGEPLPGPWEGPLPGPVGEPFPGPWDGPLTFPVPFGADIYNYVVALPEEDVEQYVLYPNAINGGKVVIVKSRGEESEVSSVERSTTVYDFTGKTCIVIIKIEDYPCIVAETNLNLKTVLDYLESADGSVAPAAYNISLNATADPVSEQEEKNLIDNNRIIRGFCSRRPVVYAKPADPVESYPEASTDVSIVSLNIAYSIQVLQPCDSEDDASTNLKRWDIADEEV